MEDEDGAEGRGPPGGGLVGAVRELLDDVMRKCGDGVPVDEEEDMRLEMEMGLREVEKNVRVYCVCGS